MSLALAFTVGQIDTSVAYVTTALVLATLTALVAFAWVVVRRRAVSDASLAVKYIDELNARYVQLVQVRPPINDNFPTRVSSKSKFDKFDLATFMTTCVLENEAQFDQEILARLDSISHFESYDTFFEDAAREWLGKSSHERINDKQFRAIERSLIGRRKLRYPTPYARLFASVIYTSPKGQNSYSRSLSWNFDQLRAGLQTAKDVRSNQSTVQAMRLRERSLVTNAVRMTVLRRDDYRCRMCGASGRDGAKLHVDHMIPVSRGGLSVMENLQALCVECNMGKGNKFSG